MGRSPSQVSLSCLDSVDLSVFATLPSVLARRKRCTPPMRHVCFALLSLSLSPAWLGPTSPAQVKERLLAPGLELFAATSHHSELAKLAKLAAEGLTHDRSRPSAMARAKARVERKIIIRSRLLM